MLGSATSAYKETGSRWLSLTKPFDNQWPRRRAVVTDRQRGRQASNDFFKPCRMCKDTNPRLSRVDTVADADEHLQADAVIDQIGRAHV